MEMRSPPPAEAVVVMDRFVSSSSAQDAVNSLEQILDAFRNSTNGIERKEDEINWQPIWIFEHEEIVEHLIWLLQRGTLKANESPCEEGAHLICKLYQYLIKCPEALMKPSPGVLLESLLDILDSPDQPVYVRVLALRLLEDLSKEHKSIAGKQWLEAPNGLYRIADLLAIDVENNPMEEAIRNQALVVAKSLAREAPMAKVFLFAEVDCKLLDLCWKEGGLTKGSPIVIDALELIQEVLKHADKSLQDLVWQRPNVAPRLVQLLDLRGGDEFLHPTQKSKRVVENVDDADDLDSILASGDGNAKDENRIDDTQSPHLLPSEEIIVKLVFNILRLLLETDSVREIVWKQQTGLCNIVWHLALVDRSNPPVCALPPPSLQQEALNLVADKFNDPIIMDGLSGLDRLLHLVCTGGGLSSTFKEKLGISQSALAVLRRSLSGDRIHDILMRTLAPPPTEDENAPLNGPTVVQKLWNTVQENMNTEASEERTLFLSGALGGLGLMLCDEQSREIMFKVTPISLDEILEHLINEEESFVMCSLLRFLCEWIYQCPFTAHNLLSSTASTILAEMATTQSDYQSLTHLLLGLAMEYLTNEEDCGGWTRNGILQIILKIGISKYTSSLEGLKTAPNQKMPWVVSDMEYKNWKEFCRQAVLTVRKRVVEELAAGSGDSDDESDFNDTELVKNDLGPTSSQAIKSLQRLVSQQTREIEELSFRLEASESKVASQNTQLNTWKRRMESTPTELDHMLSEFTSKNSDLTDKVKLFELEIEREKSARKEEKKKMQENLSKYEAEADRLRSQKQEVRDDLERTEQEMKALSQAYSSLEEEYQKQQKEDVSSAQSTETLRQPEDKVFHEQNGIGSTEITTLRSENSRLKSDAQKADEWMSMAVQKMSEMGNANVELEKQVSFLNGKIEESQAVADNMHLDVQSKEHQRQSLEADLEEERKLHLVALERLSHVDDLQIQLDREHQRSESLQALISDQEQALSNFQNMKLTIENLKQEKAKLEEKLNATSNTNDQLPVSNIVDDEKLEKVYAEHDEILATKNAEIDNLKFLLQKKDEEREYNGVNPNTNKQGFVSSGETIVDDARQVSQEEIYRLESIIRELKDRLGSDLGPYKIEDILVKDEEIEELRRANESAQEWMAKAVEHNNMNSNQIQKLTDENASLAEQLKEEREKQSFKSTENSQSIGSEDSVKWEETDLIVKKMTALETELSALKKEKNANQGLLDELGIAMDDVAVMQQKLLELESRKAELERKLSENVLNVENEDLKSSNEDLQNRLNKFEDWAQEIQTKIGDMISQKNEAESRLENLRKEVHSLQKENDSLKSTNNNLEDKERVADQFDKDIEDLRNANEYLREEKAEKERQHEDLQSRNNNLLESFNSLKQEVNVLLKQKDDLEKDLMEERTLSASRSTEIQDLKATNATLTDSLEEAKVRNGDNEVTGAESVAAKDVLSPEEDVAFEWEERASKLEFDLANAQRQLKEQEDESINAIAKWQQNVSELEEKCAGLEENLRMANEMKTSMTTKSNAQELSLVGNSTNQVDSDFHSVDTVVKLQEALKIAQDSLSKDEEVVRQWEERSAELETKIESLETELRESELEANEVISQWQDSCAAAESKYASLEEEFNRLKEERKTKDMSSGENSGEDNLNEKNHSNMMQTLGQKEEEIRQLTEETEHSNLLLQNLKDDVLSLNRQIESKNTDLANQEVEASKSIQEWKAKLDLSQQENSRIKDDLMDAKSKLIEVQNSHEKVSNNYQIDLRSEEKVRELTETIVALEGQLKDQQQEALDAVEQWQSACSNLEMKCINLEEIIEGSRKMISTRGWYIEQLRSCNESYCAQIEILKLTPRKVESSLREKLASTEAEIVKMEVKLKTEKRKTTEARAEIESLTDALKNSNFDSGETLNQWSVRCKDLETSLAEAHQQLEEQEIEANEAISIWEKKTDELEMELDVAEDQLYRLREILIDNENRGTEVNLVVATEKLVLDNTNLNSQIENAKTTANENTLQMQRLESENNKLSNLLSTSKKSYEEMKLKCDQLTQEMSLNSEDKLEKERDRLIGVVAQLEEELCEANSMLQACVTDGSADKASEFAANAIRDDIHNMRNQLNEYQQKFDDEKAAREVAELEVEHLHDDIAALLSLSDHEKNPTNIKKLAIKSVERLQKLKHSEIDELRKSLHRALEELECSRSVERKTSETMSKLRLQVSMYEQEIISAKTEVNYLSEAMEELRQTEDNKRASLEYRIGSLENENEVVRKYQANEVESLRNELAQMTMEKDVIMYQLKETEKTNASLVLAISNEESVTEQSSTDIHSECAKLRIENAHLLTIAAEDKAKAERRLRELLSAQVASSELDVILEHELRISAEASLQKLKEEIDALRNINKLQKTRRVSDASMEKEVKDLRNSLDNLKDQNSRLTITMEEEASKAKNTIDILTEECRKAQAKAFKFNRDTRTELAVQSEISKMRISTIAFSEVATNSHEDFLHDTKITPSKTNFDLNLPSAEAFDLIRRQQNEIKEERMMYNETLKEHEDLLALVAQQDIEKSYLREALIEVAGDDVANDALKRAEEIAVSRYGNAVHVSE